MSQSRFSEVSRDEADISVDDELWTETWDTTAMDDEIEPWTDEDPWLDTEPWTDSESLVAIDVCGSRLRVA